MNCLRQNSKVGCSNLRLCVCLSLPSRCPSCPCSLWWPAGPSASGHRSPGSYCPALLSVSPPLADTMPVSPLLSLCRPPPAEPDPPAGQEPPRCCWRSRRCLALWPGGPRSRLFWGGAPPPAAQCGSAPPLWFADSRGKKSLFCLVLFLVSLATFMNGWKVLDYRHKSWKPPGRERHHPEDKSGHLKGTFSDVRRKKIRGKPQNQNVLTGTRTLSAFQHQKTMYLDTNPQKSACKRVSSCRP